MSNNSNSNKRIAKNSIVLTVQMVFVLIITLYSTRVVLNTLGAVDYGIYNVVCGFVSMFAFLNASVANGLQRFFNFELGRNGIDGANKVFVTSLVIEFVLVLVVVTCAEIFGLWYLKNKLVIPSERLIPAIWIFHFSVLSFAFILIQAPFLAAILAHEKMKYYALVCFWDAVLKLAIVLLLSYLPGDKLITYGILFSLISVLNFALYFIYSKRNFAEIRLNFSNYDKNLFKKMASFTGWNFFGSFGNMMREQGLNIVLNLFFGPIVNTARGIATQVNGGVQSFVSNLSVSIRPQVVQSYAQGDISRSLSLTFCISKLSCLCLYLFSLPLLIEIDYVLKTWLGENIPEYTSIFVIIIILTSFLNNLNAAISNIVHATGKMKLYQISSGLCILSAVFFAYIVLYFGGTADLALFMTFISMLITQIVALIILKKIVPYKYSDYLRIVIYPLFVVIILSLWIPYVIYALPYDGFCRFIITCISSFLIVICLIYCFGLNKSEREIILLLIKKINHHE